MGSVMELLLQGLSIRVRLMRIHMYLTCTAAHSLHNQVNKKEQQGENKKEKNGELAAVLHSKIGQVLQTNKQTNK